MYEDLVSGSLGSPGLLNAATNTPIPIDYWRDAFLNPLLSMLNFAMNLMHLLISYITSTPLVMAVIAFFFVGFIVSLFFRVYNSV